MSPPDRPPAALGDRPDLSVLLDPARVNAVERIVLDAPGQVRVQDLTRLAAAVLGADYAQVSLLGAAEQHVAALHGAELDDSGRRSPVEASLCTVTAAFGAPLAIEDAQTHPWVSDLPPVATGAVSSYLGVLLCDQPGNVLGSLCVYGSEPREWLAGDVARLLSIAELVADELDSSSRSNEGSSTSIRLELAAAAADLGSFDHDLGTGLLVWDARMRALHGLTEADVAGDLASFESVVHPEDLPGVRQATDSAVEALGDLVLNYRVRLPGGGHRWVKARGRVLPGLLGQAARIVGAAYDSSAERGLSEELSRLLETMPAAFVRVDHDWSLTYANAGAEASFGRRRHELIGRPLWEAFPEASGTEAEEAYRQARATGQPTTVEVRLRGAWLEVHVWPDAQGMSFFLQDVTHRKDAEQALEREVRVLQSALLPKEAQAVPHVVVATRYLPATSGALAGGDFFKTVRVEGRLVVMLGDVMGHGTASAARAGQLHSLGAALALEGHGPGALLERLARGVHQMMDLELATLLVCSYDPATRLLTCATAGHPPPLVAPVVGQPRYLDLEPGPPIGVATGEYAELVCALEAGSTTVLFSDGLVERRDESIETGLERLRQAVAELRMPPEAVADHVLEELGCRTAGSDDVALLVLSHL
ncbi:MAG: SpoIIE family protein phosphatase [Mycobacteriales bacterium]|nr:SpoIIE family protein phosphatase [Mycobacteriales bacterium]